LGRYLSKALLELGDEIIFLGRRSSMNNFEQRLIDALRQVGWSGSIKVRFVDFDLGIDDNPEVDELLKNCPKIDGIWHLAANLSFRRRDKESVYATNVGGIRKIFNLAERLHCPLFYMSTAYVHGTMEGYVLEKILKSSKHFNNAYEHSKHLTEQLVAEWGQSGKQYIIFRPSILIERERKVESSFGYYAVMSNILHLKNNLLTLIDKRPVLSKAIASRTQNDEIRVNLFLFCSRKCKLNLMPVDTAVQWMMSISEQQDSLNKIFHITNPNPFPIRTALQDSLRAAGIQMRVIGTSRLLASIPFVLFTGIGMFVKTLGKTAHILSMYKSYMINYNEYEMQNTARALNINIAKELTFDKDFIFKLGRDYISKVE